MKSPGFFSETPKKPKNPPPLRGHEVVEAIDKGLQGRQPAQPGVDALRSTWPRDTFARGRVFFPDSWDAVCFFQKNERCLF